MGRLPMATEDVKMSPRHQGARFSEENLMSLAPHARLYDPHREEIGAAVRGWREPDQRERLYILSEVIRRWASRFDDGIVLALAAGAVSNDSLSRFLCRIAEWINECEPKTWGGPSARPTKDPEVLKLLHDLEQILTAIELLNEFATGRVVFYPLDHAQPLADSNIGVDREPADDETDFYLRSVLATSLSIADQPTLRKERELAGERVRALAIQTVDRLQQSMDTPSRSRGGLGLEEVDSAVLKQPADSPAIQIHDDMKQVLQDLQELAHGEESKTTTPTVWGECINRLLACWAPWIDKCFYLLDSGRSNRQSKKDDLERDVACVTQYAFAMNSIESLLRDRFVHVVLCLLTLSRRMQELLRKIELPNELPSGTDTEVRNKINELDILVVDDAVRDRWRMHFGKNTQTVGRTVDVIVKWGNGQDEPWQQGDKRQCVDVAGLLEGASTKKAREDRFRKRLYRMQQIAVAVQIPHELLAGKPMRPKHKGEKLHAAEGWLVNPLAAVLANETVPAPAPKAARPAKRRPRTTAQKKKPKK